MGVVRIWEWEWSGKKRIFSDNGNRVDEIGIKKG